MQQDHIAGSERIAGPMGPQPPSTAHQSPGIRHRAAMGPQARESSWVRVGRTDKQPAPAEGRGRRGRTDNTDPITGPARPHPAPHSRRQGPGSQAGGWGADRPAGPCLLCYRISWDRPKAEAKPGAEGRRTEPGCGCCTRKQAGRNQPSMAGAGGAEAKPERSPENDLLQLMIYCCSDPAPADGILPL